jgi:hypothetical protein
MNAQTQATPGNNPSPTQPSRSECWADTCRELTRMRNRSARGIGLYQQFGCRFWPPDCAQVESILSALDAALPESELQHLELFYQALELNYPELLRQLPGAA